jgi:hypothetical protein
MVMLTLCVYYRSIAAATAAAAAEVKLSEKNDAF